jgi:regulator of protease activity HflC (stomatin/prohibitin superfamily)
LALTSYSDHSDITFKWREIQKLDINMNASSDRTLSKENAVNAVSGWPMLAINLLGCVAVPFVFAAGVNQSSARLVIAAVLLAIALAMMWGGFFTLQPNEARVLVLFGKYKGTVRQSGFHWTNPFIKKLHVSLRARNLNGEKLKVNDKRGNPIEIAAVVVWRIDDTAQATFDVENCGEYVRIQSETAVRHLATSFAYDHGEENETTLRSGAEEVQAMLKSELQDRLAKAGVAVDEARLTHLAYAPEIASAMLRRQQAEAVIAARQKIVHGAVSMVEMALRELAAKTWCIWTTNGKRRW